MLDIPTSSQDEVLQDIFNRQVDEKLQELQDKLDYIKNIPDDGTINSVAGIIDYLRGM